MRGERHTELTQADITAIGMRLYDLRIEHDLSIRELSLELLCTASAISTWENGKFIPSTPMVMKYSEHFGVSTDWILFGKEYEE
jgi:transcriptional regulator with XRE-family HTH domain